MYTIDFKEKYDDSVIYLCEHENEIIKRLLKPAENAVLLWPKELGNHRDYYITNVTEGLIAIILNRRYDFKEVSDYTLYVGAVVTRVDDITGSDDVHSSDNRDIVYTLDYVTCDDWYNDFSEKVAEEIDVTGEEREDHQLVLDIIDNFMAKGRESQRAKERGDKYLARQSKKITTNTKEESKKA